jgi:DNA-binding beta-propeller fold protein YncE
MKRLALAFASLTITAGCTRAIQFASPDAGEWALPPTPVWAHQKRLATTDNGDDTLAFVSDDGMLSLLGMMPVGDIPVELEGPHHVAASPDGKYLFIDLSNYVPGSGTGPHGAHGLGTVPGSLLKIDAATTAKVAETQVDKNPGDVILNAAGDTAYVSHYDLIKLQTQITMGLPDDAAVATIAIVNTQTMARPPLYPACATAHGMALSPDEKTLYVACVQVDQLAIFDLGTNTAKRIPVGPAPGMPLTPNYQPYAINVAPDGKVWVACNGPTAGGTGFSGLRVYDPAMGAFDESLSVPFQGQGMAAIFLGDGKTTVGVSRSDDKLLFIDYTQTPPMVVKELGLQQCTNAHTMRVSQDGATGWVVCEGDHTNPGTLVAIDLRAQAYLGAVKVGVFPDGVVELPPAP